MTLAKLVVEQPQKVKATVGKPVKGYLKKARTFSFKNDEGDAVMLLDCRIQPKDGGKVVRTYLTGANVELVDKLVVGAFTQISKRVIKDKESDLEFEVTDVAQDTDDVLKG